VIELDLYEVGSQWLVCFAAGYGVGLTVYILRRVGDAM